MLKYLLLLALGALLWWHWRKARDGAVPPSETPRPVERMVRCAHCGVHLPESDALADGARHYCNAAHRDAARRAGG